MVKVLPMDEGVDIFQGMVSEHLFPTAWGEVQRFHKNLGNYNNIFQLNQFFFRIHLTI
jgi:hypothetical protein